MASLDVRSLFAADLARRAVSAKSQCVSRRLASWAICVFMAACWGASVTSIVALSCRMSDAAVGGTWDVVSWIGDMLPLDPALAFAKLLRATQKFSCKTYVALFAVATTSVGPPPSLCLVSMLCEHRRGESRASRGRSCDSAKSRLFRGKPQSSPV